MYFDITILVLVCVTALIGFAKGMLSQVISLAAFAGSIIVTGMVQGRVSSWLQGVVTARFPDIQVDPRMTQFAAAVLLFCALYFAMGSVLEFVKRKTVVALSLQISDRFLGLFIGIGKGLAASLLIIAAVQWTQGVTKRFMTDTAYMRYEKALEHSLTFAGGCQVIDWMRARWPELDRLAASAGAAAATPGAPAARPAGATGAAGAPAAAGEAGETGPTGEAH